MIGEPAQRVGLSIKSEAIAFARPERCGKYEVCKQIEITPVKETPLLPSIAA
jgi:hypothetical protein